MTLGFYDEMKLVLQDEEMSWLDKSCLHLAVRKKDKIETVTFQVGPRSLSDQSPGFPGVVRDCHLITL